MEKRGEEKSRVERERDRRKEESGRETENTKQISNSHPLIYTYSDMADNSQCPA